MDSAKLKKTKPVAELAEDVVPVPIQTFLWRQTSSFLRPKLGRLHEASCIFCQQAPGHHEMKEACKSLEKILVQNIQVGLPPSFSEAIRSVTRWKFVQSSLPHVMLCTAQLISERKDSNSLQNVGTAASKLLYTLHWTLLDAAEECADADREAGFTPREPFPYIFPLTSIQEFVYLFAPLRHLLKEADLQNFRLENGLKIWPALWDYRHPNAQCFTAPVRPKKSCCNARNKPTSAGLLQSPTEASASASVNVQPVSIGTDSIIINDVFSGSMDKDSDIGDSRSLQDVDAAGRPSKENEFPETIPEETSSTEEEHVVIFRLPSAHDSDGIRDSSIYRAESSIIHPRSYLTADYNGEGSRTTISPDPANGRRLLNVRQESWFNGEPIDPKYPHRRSSALEDVTAATFLDVAVVRCLFMPRWSEEGVHWALQFLFYRLQEISEELRSRCPQRKRSSSLPVPKIEVSLCSNECTKTNKVEAVRPEDSSEYNRDGQSPPNVVVSVERTAKEEGNGSSITGTNGGGKRRKMADLKAFVETRLLSRSDKMLEKIDEKHARSSSFLAAPILSDRYPPNSNEEAEHTIPPRPLSALANSSDDMARRYFTHEQMPLVKGKSMPSLSCLVDELAASGYLGLATSTTESRAASSKKSKERDSRVSPVKKSQPVAISSASVQHPIITVTEPNITPSASRHYVVDGGEKRSSSPMNRSQTDSNISYPYEDLPEAAGASRFVNREGGLDFHVILEAIHSVTTRADVCSVRVCETSLSMLELLLDLGVVSAAGGKEDANGDEDMANVSHSLCIDMVARVFQHVGCPHGCGDSRRDPSSDFIRSQGLLLMAQLHRISAKNFRAFLRHTVTSRYTLAEVVDLLHALVGFCVDPGFVLSPISQKRSSRLAPDPLQTGMNYAPNFNSPRTIEGHVINCIFKPFVSRLTASLKFLKSSDNVALYCDVRQLLAYIKDVHGGVFRRVLLSGLLDAAARPQQAQDTPPENGRYFKDCSGSDEGGGVAPATFFVVDETTSDKNRKGKKASSEMDSWTEESGLLRKGSVVHALALSAQRFKDKEKTSKQRFNAMGSRSNRKATNKLGIGWMRKDRRHQGATNSGTAGTSEEPMNVAQAVASSPALLKLQQRGASSNNVGITLQKARRRVEHHLTRIGFGKHRRQIISREATPDPSRRNSLETESNGREMFMVIPRERKMVSTAAVYDGMLRLNFLLEACQPGTVPDAHLIAAVLDLPQAPVVARAAFLFECAHFVHRCNRGQWPSWMKLNLPFYRPSGPLSNRGTPSGQRRTHILQRLGGRMFFSWAEAIGVRLEEILIDDALCNEEYAIQGLDEQHQRLLLEEDENEDFLVEASVNPSGRDFPWALRLAACMLLYEITAFMRDSYRRLPRSARVSLRSNTNEPTGTTKSTGSCPVGSLNVAYGERASNAAPGISESILHNPSTLALATTPAGNPAGRRWSMALSSMGHSQASAQSLQSITGDGHSIGGVPGERKISFVLHEPDDESPDSSNTTLTFQGDDGSEERRNRRLAQGRPFLLRRSTMSNTGSFKRRSLKLRRSHRESRRDPDSESIKRTDSIRSKRKVSSISDRSDFSDAPLEHDISGEESPGILSDDQPPESPSDCQNEVDEGISTRGMPWLRAVLLLANSFNYQCTHQHVCHPRCFRRQSRACSRLLFSVRKIYGDEPMQEALEFLSFGKKPRHPKEETKKEKAKGAQSRPGSPLRRKESVSKKERCNTDMLSKASSCHSSTAALSRDHIDHEHWDRSKISVSIQGGKGFPHEMDNDEQKVKKKEEHAMVKYIKLQVMDLFQAPLLVLIKSATIMNDEAFLDIIPIAWELILDVRKETAAAAAAMFILSAVRCPEPVTALLHGSLRHSDPVERFKALLKFQVLWRSRYQVWPRMEEGAAHTFKVPPHSIEFTLPSPKIGMESLPVVDPPWMPHVRTRVQDVTLSQDTHRSLVTATKTRKKQQTELVESALKAEEDRKCSERENFLITTIPVVQQASYEPALHHAAGDDHDDADDETQQQSRNASQPLHTAQVLFPSCLCSAIVAIVDLLDDSALTPDGAAVCDLANQVTNSCLVEDTALFLRHVLEKLTREKQDEMFAILRRLLRFVPHLPQQTAFTIHNYLIGYIMFYVRSPMEGSQELVANALSLLASVAPNVQGLLFKDMKQVLRKEQCDAAILITANVPSAKKIVVHGPPEPDSAGIPSQFPVQEDTQFSQILQESLDFFSIDENKQREYFLVDLRTNQIHNPSAYVRDYYFFKRSQNPQLNLVHMDPVRAHDALQKQAFTEKMSELGKIQLVTAVLKTGQIVARVLFLHEELMKLPSFPRKALEADLSLYSNGSMGKELSALDFMHKLSWVKLVRQMFEAMVGNFAYSADIHLFINVINGALVLYCEDAVMLRFCMATYINAGHQFRNVFAVNGYSLIIPTILRIYSNYQSNPLVARTIEFTVQQFYIMHRKPFMLQLFGSVAPLLDTDESSVYGDASKVRVQSLFRLLLSLERIGADPLHLLDLVCAEKPLKALDFCYHGESDTINILDSIALAVMGASYAIDTPRGHQLLMILEAILPAYLKHLQTSAGRKDPRTERDILHQLGVAMKTLVTNAEALTKHYTGPQKTFEKSPSQKPPPKAVLSTTIEIDEDSHSRFLGDHFRSSTIPERTQSNDSEVQWQEFRMPRMTLLSLVSDYYTICCARLTELNKKQGQDKSSEPLDVKCNARLADIAHALLKVASYDANTMACRGLQQYMTVLMPNGDWSQEPMKQALNTLFRRLDKIFSKIYKIPSVRKNTDWDAAACLLRGVYLTLRKSPFIVHATPLRSLITTCQSLILGDLSSSMSAMDGSPVHIRGGTMAARRTSLAPPPSFCSVVVQLIAMQILALGETYSLEQACGGNFSFPTAERTESILLNLLLPLCLRVGSGRKDAPRVRQTDISFALTVVLHALNPPHPHQTRAPVTKNISSGGDGSRGSVSVNSSDLQRQHRSCRPSLMQVSFLGLKILLTCFSQQLTLDWPRVARCVREIGERKEDIATGGGAFWNFLIFVATQRGPLFPLILPLMWSKVSVSVENEEEQILQDLLRQKLNGSSEISPLPAGELMDRFLSDLMVLNDEFTNQREDEVECDNRRNIVPDGRSEVSNPSANSRRPTIDSNASRDRSNAHRDFNLLLAPSRGGLSSGGIPGLRRQWSVRSESRPAAQAAQRQISLQAAELGKEGYRINPDKINMRRTSYAGEASYRPNVIPSGTAAASDTRLNRRSYGPITSASSLMSDSFSEVDFCELDETSGDVTPLAADGGSTSLDSPSTPLTSAPVDQPEQPPSAMHPRLHRQKLQSKTNRGKNFRSFRSGKAVASIEVSHIEVEQELVTLPPAKPPTCSTPLADQGQPFQLLLVPSSSGTNATNNNSTAATNRAGSGIYRRGTGLQSPSAETRLMTGSSLATAVAVATPPERAESGTVSVGVAVQVPASSYIPPKRIGPKRTEPPPPVPPRSHHIRPSSMQQPGGSIMNRPCSSFLEHPLLEESDTAVADAKNGSSTQAGSSSQEDSDVENSQSGMLACVSNANDTSIESLVLEETALLLPAATSGRALMRNITETEENTLI